MGSPSSAISQPSVGLRRRRRAIALNVSSGVYLVLLAAVWLAMSFAGDRTWYTAAMLIVPRWPLLLPLVVLGPWVIASKRVVPMLLFLASVWISVFAIMGVHVHLYQPDRDRGELRVLTCNVHRRQLDAAALRAYLDTTKPDIVALQDWSAVHEEELFPRGAWHVRRLGELLVASQYPVRDPSPIDLKLDPDVSLAEQGESAVFVVETPQGPVSIVNLHLGSPHIGLLEMFKDGGATLTTNVKRRWLESALVRARVDEVSGPLLVLGDFNTTPDSPIAREHWSHLIDAFAACGSGLGYTYFNNHAQLRIDRVLSNASIRAVNCLVGPFVGSPHHPFVVDFRYSPNSPRGPTLK